MLKPSEVESLLSALCVELGFCLPPAENARLTSNPPTNVLEFTRAVFRAEGLEIELADLHLVRQVRERVAKAFEHREGAAAPTHGTQSDGENDA